MGFSNAQAATFWDTRAVCRSVVELFSRSAFVGRAAARYSETRRLILVGLSLEVVAAPEAAWSSPTDLG